MNTTGIALKTAMTSSLKIPVSMALSGPVYYAAKTRTVSLGSMGGIKINEQTEVIDKQERSSRACTRSVMMREACSATATP